MLLYRIFKPLARLYFFLTHPMKVYGRENLKYTGKMILICNHLGNHDGFVVHFLVKGRPRFMAKKELFNNRFFAAVIRDFGAFPVERGAADRAAITTAVELLKEGGTLAMFPEGTRNRADESIQPFMNGAAMVALRAGAPVLPICMLRRPKFFRFTHVAVGKPIDLADLTKEEPRTSDKIRIATEYLYQQVRGLKENTKPR